jgi:hypothetical protein
VGEREREREKVRERDKDRERGGMCGIYQNGRAR